MNEQTTKLIEQLANKLGTTTEYIWSVLISQAPISATIDLIYIVISILVGCILFFLYEHLSKKFEDYDEEAEILIQATFFTFMLIWVLLFICAMLQLPNIINGYFNPEYWALKEILRSLK